MKTTITSRKGHRIDPIIKQPAIHHGTDFGIPIGTPIPSPIDGKVSRNDYTTGNGNRIAIYDFVNGIEHHFYHLNNLSSLEVNNLVIKGQIIGYSGNTGKSSGAHLHYEIRSIIGKYPNNVIDPKEEDIQYLDQYFLKNRAL